MLFNLSEQDSVANQFLLELRDRAIQNDRMRFRRNVERLGEIMAYEVSKKLRYVPSAIETTLGRSTSKKLSQQPVLITIMRAGLAYFQGFLNFFDQADSGFVGAYRQEGGEHVTIKLDYVATPEVAGRDVILIDPMLATGRSILDSIRTITTRGIPAHIYIVSLIAAPEGIKYLQENLTINHSIWTCAVDEKLNQQFYIVPGLGDAGDLSYGEKV